MVSRIEDNTANIYIYINGGVQLAREKVVSSAQDYFILILMRIKIVR